jgi:hypothetical protein
MPEVDLLILASSRKHGGRCIAGWDLTNERWLRPVSSQADGTLELEHCTVNGAWPEVFDVVHLEIGDHRPSPYQPENYVISGTPWELVRQEQPGDVSGLLENLVETDHWLLRSNDRRVQAAVLRANAAPSSLLLVHPSSLTWRVETAPWGDRQRKADFRIGGGGWYDWSVTDIPVYEQLRELDDGNYPRDTVGIDDDSDVLLTISLAEPYQENDACYKLVAAVLEVETD